MTKIWALEDGEYSDYHVIGVFSSRENAEIVQKVTRGTIAEWPLDPAVKEINQGLTTWRVLMLRNGDVESAKSIGPMFWAIGGRHYVWERTKAPAYLGSVIPDVLWAEVWARDQQHAIKIVNEKRAQMIAMDEWPG